MNEVQRHQTKNKDTESKYAILNEIFQVSNEHHWITLKYQHTSMVDIAWIDEIMETGINKFPEELINKLVQKVNMVLSHKPFEVVVIHDSFSCHPNNCNQMRFHYKEIIAELAESTLIDDILEQLYGEKIDLPKGESIAHYIRNSNYGIC